MPLFKRSPDNISKARLEHKMCVAKDTPEPVFDLTECSLTEIPPGVFSMCRVFRKDTLLLSENQLTQLKSGGSLQDLAHIQVFDLHSNKLAVLPENFGCLLNLQVLNLNGNKLKKLPNSFSNLSKLEQLNIGDNQFKSFPEVICSLVHLHSLDISGNKVTSLPPYLTRLTSLTSLVLDKEAMIYPPADICCEGTEAVMKFLCKENEVEYVAPSQDSSETLSSNSYTSGSPTSPKSPIQIDDTYQQYQQKKDRRRQDLIEMEEEMRRSQQAQIELGAETLLRRQKMLENLAQEQERMDNEILGVQQKKDIEKHKLLRSLASLEEHSDMLINNLLELNERAKSSEVLLEAMERDRLEAESMFAVKKEEMENLRKKDVLVAMQEMLQAEERQRKFEADRLAQNKHTQEAEEEEAERKIQEILCCRGSEQQALLTQLLEEEQFQREAFLALQIQKDNRHLLLNQQINLIEKELAKLTEAELKRKEMKMNLELDMVKDRRTTLAELLVQLLEQRDLREEELKKRMKEMEERRSEEIRDYWLIQYQRLMDKKPQEIVEMELAMDPSVRQVLNDVGAPFYITNFALQEVTLEQLISMTPMDFRRLGINDRELRLTIQATAYKLAGFEEFEPEDKESPEGAAGPCEPSAPMPDVSPSAPPSLFTPEAEVRLWQQAECVICMEVESAIVFLPCGHVCTCWPCAKDLDICPLCRLDIISKLSIAEKH